MHNGVLEADMPVMAVTDEAPKYSRPMEPRPLDPIDRGQIDFSIPEGLGGSSAYTKILQVLLASPNIASKHWVYEQYDTMVRTNSAVLPGADAAVVRVKETRRAIAMCLDGNGRYTAANAREGAKLAVAEGARNVVCVGARPIAVTNCLNFASPERPEVMQDFSDVIDGMVEACEKFETPVVSGNVSFYNETDGRGILPTPVIGMIGLIEDSRKIITQGFKNDGDLIALLGTTNDDLFATEYISSLGLLMKDIIGWGRVPKLDLDLEKRVQEACLALADERLLNSAHDCSDGGLSVAIAESCFSSLGRKSVGANIEIECGDLIPEAALFGESPSRIVVSFKPENMERVREIAESQDCPFALIGKVEGSDLNIAITNHKGISCPVSELEGVWKNSLAKTLKA
jgi:phosphoribosylformylglycinamidine (FGAM) synthase-like enzyme